MDLIVPSGTEQNNLKQTKMDNLKVAVIPTETDNELTPNDPIEKILAHKEVVVYSLELYFHKQNEMELPIHYSVLFNMDFVSDQGKQGKPVADIEQAFHLMMSGGKVLLSDKQRLECEVPDAEIELSIENIDRNGEIALFSEKLMEVIYDITIGDISIPSPNHGRSFEPERVEPIKVQPVAELSPQERKEAFIVELMARIEGKLTDRLTTQFTTCSCAPAFGWSVDEYNYMPTVARRLREKGYTVSSSVNHEVTDWLISV